MIVESTDLSFDSSSSYDEQESIIKYFPGSRTLSIKTEKSKIYNTYGGE